MAHCTYATHHVEQYAKARLIAFAMGFLSPILRSKSPRVTIIIGVTPLRHSPVLGIETYEIHSYINTVGMLQKACYLKHYGHTARSVVGSRNWFAPVGAVGIVVGPGTAVPMRTKQTALLVIWTKTGNDIAAFEWSAVISLDHCFLTTDSHT